MRVRRSAAFAGVFAMVLAVACSESPTQPDPLDSSQIVSFDRQGLGSGPKVSQRLRGLGGRTFAVHVQQVEGPGAPNEFDNCYTFLADGTWVDPLFPNLGTWEQHSLGAATSYTGFAEVDLGFVAATLVQEGTVTPANGGGVLQLEAYSTAVVEFAGQPPFEQLFFSEGEEVDICPFDL